MAFVIFGLSWKVVDSVMLSILAAASIGLSIFGFLTWTSQIFYADVILKRIWELEKQMGLKLHLLIKSKDEEQELKSPILNLLKKLKYLADLSCVSLGSQNIHRLIVLGKALLNIAKQLN